LKHVELIPIELNGQSKNKSNALLFSPILNTTLLIDFLFHNEMEHQVYNVKLVF